MKAYAILSSILIAIATAQDLRGTNKTLAPTPGAGRPSPLPVTPFPTEPAPKTASPVSSIYIFVCTHLLQYVMYRISYIL